MKESISSKKLWFAVGSVLALTSADSVNGSHRGHHQFLAKALHHVEPKLLDPAFFATAEVVVR